MPPKLKRRRRRGHRRAPYLPDEETCDLCAVGDHKRCEGETLYGEVCRCPECEHDALAAAQDLSERIEPGGSPE